MACKGVARISCPGARTPWCVCSCGGACHGRENGVVGRPVSRQMSALLQFLSELRHLGILTPGGAFAAPRGRRRVVRPSRHKRLRRLLLMAGFFPLGGGWGFQVPAEGRELWEEILRLLNWLEMEMSGPPPAPLSPKVAAELEALLAELEVE